MKPVSGNGHRVFTGFLRVSRWVPSTGAQRFLLARASKEIYTEDALAGRRNFRRVPLFFSYRALPHGRTCCVRRQVCLAALGLLFVRLNVPQALASSAHRASIAAFARAEAIQRRLEARPISERTRTDYERALDAYRVVYHGDPASPDAARSIAAVADLLASEGRCFHDARLSHDAVAQWEFLRTQYPGSPLRQRALLQQAEIEQQDLHDRADAKKIYRSFLTHYPHDALVEEARAGLRGVPRTVTSEDRPAVISRSTTPTAAKIYPRVFSPRPELGPASTSDSAVSKTRSPLFPAPTYARPVPVAKANLSQPRISSSASVGKSSVATIQGVRYWAVQSSTRLAVDMSGAVPYHAYLAQDGRQITLIFFGARPAETLLQHPVAVQQDANLRSVRVSALTADQTELAVELNHPASFSSFTLSNPDRLILDLHAAQPSDLSAIAARYTAQHPHIGEPESSSNDAPSLHKAVVRTPKNSVVSSPESTHASATARYGTPKILPETEALARPTFPAEPTMDGQPSMTRVLGLKIRRIVIDAGHGGHDSGTLGAGGLEEKDVALDVALRLGHLLQQRLGADVIYTRRTDKFVPLEERTAIANRAHADLFISIHANSSSDPEARGVETYFLNFTGSPGALAVAARENAVSDRSVHELSDLVRKITLSDKIDESREFAGDVQQSLYSGLAPGNSGMKNRGVKQAPFVVLIGAHMPSILAEISFLTNPQDASELAQSAYRERLAEALYRGVARYVDGMSGVRVAKTARPQRIPTPAE